MSPLISIIVPCYNQAEYLSEALNSVLEQTYEDWECIIINDGSSDTTRDIAQHYCKRDYRFEYIEQENQGVANARNNGIKVSKGKYVLPLDADDKFGPEYVELAIQRFAEYPNTTLVYCKAELFGDINQSWDLPVYNYSNFIWENCIFCSAIFKRLDFDKTNGYDPKLSGLEDWDYWLSILSKDSIVYQIDKTLFYYRITSSSRNINANLRQEEICKQIYDNHKNIYCSYTDSIIFLKKQIIQLTIDGDSRVKAAYNSNAYKVGFFILQPFVHIKKNLKRLFFIQSNKCGCNRK